MKKLDFSYTEDELKSFEMFKNAKIPKTIINNIGHIVYYGSYNNISHTGIIYPISNTYFDTSIGFIKI